MIARTGSIHATLGREADRDQIDGAIRILFEPDQVVEVRVPGKFGAVAGYFDDHKKLAKAIKRLSDEGDQAGVYVTLNPCHNGVLARRSGNRLHENVEATTSDADIVRRRWLMIDFDPKRPRGVSATKSEKSAALETMIAARAWLHSRDWAQPVVADSGNGFHLLYRVNEPNEEVTKQLFRKCLAVLSDRFSTPQVGIDTAVFNAARITKAYGSLAAKGENTPDRPHRYSKLIRVPRTGVKMVHREQLEALAANAPEAKESVKEDSKNRGGLPTDSAKVEEFLEWGGVETKQTKSTSDGAKQWILEACPFNPQHTNGPAVSWKPTGELGFHCFHESCKDYRWREFREHIEKLKGEKFRFTEWKGTMVYEAAPAATPWPDQPAPEAFDGLAGEIVRTIEPYSEADPVALLVQLMVTFGNAAGRRAHFKVEADLHFANLFAVVIGPTSKGRKGTSLGHSQRLFADVEPQWAGNCVKSGLSSGEGLIFAVRDPVLRPARIRKSGVIFNNDDDGGGKKIVDSGIEDKRLLVVETEFAQPLKVMDRDGNILSTVIRQAWDTGDLRTLTKNSPTQATGAHVSIIGHISEEELRRYLSATEQANGFGNRILWCCARRSKFLPDGGQVPADRLATLAERLGEALDFARKAGEIRRAEQAAADWREIYPTLAGDRPGLVGALMGRAEAQVTRLAMIYALLDCSPKIQRRHLVAALALWKYFEDSVVYVFGNRVGDPMTDTILNALRRTPEGITRTGISSLFSRHRDASEITRALSVLLQIKAARCEPIETDGRAEERWFAVDQGAKKA
jgi:hypothetical protein